MNINFAFLQYKKIRLKSYFIFIVIVIIIDVVVVIANIVHLAAVAGMFADGVIVVVVNDALKSINTHLSTVSSYEILRLQVGQSNEES